MGAGFWGACGLGLGQEPYFGSGGAVLGGWGGGGVPGGVPGGWGTPGKKCTLLAELFRGGVAKCHRFV